MQHAIPASQRNIPIRSVSEDIHRRNAHRLAGPRAERSVALALQGGGAHGAFTWGVLDALIEDGRLAFEAVSGASAGAINAVVMLDGWLAAGPDGAREALARFWRRASVDGGLQPAQRSVVSGMLSAWSRNPIAAFWAKALLPSPYVSNPLNINPLKFALEDTVDFERLRASDTVNVYVSATNVWTGKLALFERDTLTADHLMASACIPTVFQAVEIDGVPYWDGGYLGNPPLYPLHQGSAAGDILLIQINPVERQETPRTPQEIQNRLNEITFNANLMRELRAIDVLHGLIEDGVLGSGASANGHRPLLIHRIDGTHALEAYDAASRTDVRWRVLQRLRDHGRLEAQNWLAERFDSIGRECTLDLRMAYQ